MARLKWFLFIWEGIISNTLLRSPTTFHLKGEGKDSVPFEIRLNIRVTF